MKLPRLVFGETARERELRALVEGLQAERERKDRRIRVDREAYAAAMAALREQVEKALAERDEARDQRMVLRAEGLRSCRYRLRELIDRHDDVDRRLAEVSDAVASWRKIADQILRPWPPTPAADDIEPTNDSPEDRPAKDDGTEGAGTTPE